jgi:hypothetical protein
MTPPLRFLLGTIILALLLSPASGQNGMPTGSSAVDETVTPSNYISSLTRVIGTDVWRSSVGGLRNVGNGSLGVGGLSGTVNRAYLFWHGVSNSYDPNANRNVQVNGITVLGVPMGTSYDNNWGFLVSQSYYADVTNLVAPNPNKSYFLTGFGTGTFNPNGATLIVFYNDASSTNDYDVTVFGGNDSNGGSAYDQSGWNVSFGAIYDYNVFGDFLQLIVADGQAGTEPAMLINGQVLTNAGPVFQGTSVPSANNGPANDGSLWDSRDFNIDFAIYTAPGYNNINLTMGVPTYPGDYDSLVAAIIYVPIGPELIHIRSPRVGGNLEGPTTRYALLGADVPLTTALYPDGLTGGSYAWSATGPGAVQFVSGVNANATTVRFMQTGTYTVRVDYLRNGVTLTATMNVNVVVPSLTNFTGTVVNDQVNRNMNCSGVANGATYSLGCYQIGGMEDGTIWSTTAQIPTVTYLSDPQQSGIKFVQAVSVFRKRLNNGNFQCFTRRASQADVASGWQLDTTNPYNHPEHPPRRFSEGNTLTMTDFDAPATRLDGTPPGNQVEYDATMIDDRFETYVFYFTGNDPGNPVFQQPLRLQNSAAPLSRIAWNWGGQVTFDSAFPPVNYNIQLSNTYAGPLAAGDGNAVMPIQTNVTTVAYAPCPGTTVTTNPIDAARFFVQQQYIDILHRQPELDGWNGWKSVINRCAFDTTCIHNNRIVTARGFLESPENFSNNPALANPGMHEYNQEYVRLCYTSFLQRTPEQEGWDGWTNYLDAHPGEYDTIVGGFINSIEYRGRFGTP